MTATEYVVLVNIDDKETGIAEKLAAHQQNLLHRAFSVFIFRQSPQLEILLQQRSWQKYHSPGLWTNTCCSHPRPNENLISAGERRLEEELGIATTLKNIGHFHYNAHFQNGLSENEIDHVLIGTIPADLMIEPNPLEVASVRWITPVALEQEIAAHPDQFTPWLKHALQLVQSSASENFPVNQGR